MGTALWSRFMALLFISLHHCQSILITIVQVSELKSWQRTIIELNAFPGLCACCELCNDWISPLRRTRKAGGEAADAAAQPVG